jgi:hypothetical protein
MTTYPSLLVEWERMRAAASAGCASAPLKLQFNQVPTRAVRTEWIISRAAFRSGVEDVRAGRAPRSSRRKTASASTSAGPRVSAVPRRQLAESRWSKR